MHIYQLVARGRDFLGNKRFIYSKKVFADKALAEAYKAEFGKLAVSRDKRHVLTSIVEDLEIDFVELELED